ncbi:hypothetical protein [Pontibacillus marinus]|uniref:Uncharacterized protein n=1 Tax=Pontibacillus marinus BH030004 = DSM 16465 TaxID=1385511 RepID=A0A0A5GJ64_9BACI|nr:hypothetical protein [Pontibacillus marinus]KGX91268.1 hypothetical protein N783_11170 [Pontibacillus marinus BH030004 = DSM 16465]
MEEDKYQLKIIMEDLIKRNEQMDISTTEEVLSELINYLMLR